VQNDAGPRGVDFDAAVSGPSAFRNAPEHIADGLCRVIGQRIRILIELAGQTLCLVDPSQRDLQRFGVLCQAQAHQPRMGRAPFE